MSAIDVQNQKDIRDPMIISVKVGNTSSSIFNLDKTNIISCELRLRSDLKPIDPSLPESEIVVQAYWPNDISDDVLTIPQDTKITYQSGYDGDMSPVRTFYLAEQIKWEAKVLTIRGVDAVHFLDHETPTIISDYYNYTTTYTSGLETMKWGFEGRIGSSETTTRTSPTVTLYRNIKYILNDSGIQYSVGSNPDLMSTQPVLYTDATTVIEGNARDVIANITNLMRIDSPVSGIPNMYFTYVDAGIPVLSFDKPTSKWTIYEADCGDIKNEVKRNIVKINAPNKALSPVDYSTNRGDDPCKVGSLSMVYGNGGSFNLSDYAVCACAKTDNGSGSYMHFMPIRTSDSETVGRYPVDAKVTESGTQRICGMRLFKKGGFMPWGLDGTMQYLFMDNVSGDAGEANADLYSACVRIEDDPATYTTTGYGDTEAPSKTRWVGKTSEKKNNTVYQFLPQLGFEQLMTRSQKTGSFTWKGDPRMQPRDVFTFVYRDGTEELRTIETISLKHENGGTVAQITYRKGIV